MRWRAQVSGVPPCALAVAVMGCVSAVCAPVTARWFACLLWLCSLTFVVRWCERGEFSGSGGGELEKRVVVAAVGSGQTVKNGTSGPWLPQPAEPDRVLRLRHAGTHVISVTRGGASGMDEFRVTGAMWWSARM